MFFESMFGGAGGFPGFHTEGEPSDEEAADTEKLYNILGVSKNATDREIKKAFKKAALKHHPDRGGDAEKFKEVEKAKQILLDPQKRKLYDRFGEKGVERGGGGGGDIFDLFRGGRTQQSKGPPKPKAITQTIDITLEDVYKGSALVRKWRIKSASRRYNCSRCNGQGSVTQVVRQGPMVMQTQRPCDSCRGKGFSFPDEKEVDKTGTVHIPHGIQNGGKITLHGEGHSLPEYQNGDVTFVVRLRKHKVFQRRGADLGCEHTLTLCEALCGYEFRLKHVSGKTLIIKSIPGEVVQPGDLKKLSDHGLPQKGNHYVHGHLYIHFKVVFPLASSLSTDKMKILQSSLQKVQYPEVVETVELGQGSRVKIHLPANAAEKIYGRRTEMTAYGIIADEKREDDDSEAWPVEFDPIDKNGESRLVIVPADWIEAHEEDSQSSATKNKKRNQKKKNRRRKSKNMDVDEDEEDNDDDEYEDEEEVVLETVVGGPPKPTPAQGGSIHDEDEDTGRQGGVQCQQM